VETAAWYRAQGICRAPSLGFWCERHINLKMPILGISAKSATTRSRSHNSRGTRAKQGSSAGLAGALFSMTQQRMLGLLFGQPDRRFYANELIDLTGSGSGAVQRELQRLTGSGLVTATKEGSRRYFKANPASPLFEELRSIVLKTVGAAEPVKTALVPLAAQIQLALVYGSVAKGRETASSDLDLLVVSDLLTLERIYAAVASAERQLSRKVSITLYTPVEYQRRLIEKSPFLTKVLSGEHFALIGSAHEPIATGTSSGSGS
jgi:predicted nucleotidyltransferase